MPDARIRAAFLLPHFRPGGAERVVLNWLHALDRERFVPHLLLGRVEGAFLDALPGDVVPIRLGASRALWRSRDIARQLAALRIDAAYSATNAMNLALMAARTGGTARIISEHTTIGAYLAGAKWPWLRKAAMRRFYPAASAIAVPTPAIAAELTALLGRNLPLHCLPNPVIDESAALAPARPAMRDGSATPWQIVSAGRLVKEKGFDLLVGAIGQLIGGGLDCRLTILGEGPERAALEAQIKAAGLGGHVQLAGHVADPVAAYAAADLFVLASRREGFGNVLIEAMHAGVPVLATRCGGPDSFIADGVNGWLVAPGNADLLAARIAELLGEPAALAQTVTAGRTTAAGYGIRQSTRAFEDLLEALTQTAPSLRGQGNALRNRHPASHG